MSRPAAVRDAVFEHVAMLCLIGGFSLLVGVICIGINKLAGADPVDQRRGWTAIAIIGGIIVVVGLVTWIMCKFRNAAERLLLISVALLIGGGIMLLVALAYPEPMRFLITVALLAVGSLAMMGSYLWARHHDMEWVEDPK